DVAAQALGLLDTLARHLDGIGVLAEDRDVDLTPQHPQLLDSSRALEVGADEEGVAALLLEPAAQLPGGGRLAGSLQAGEEHPRRRLRRVGDAQAVAAEG